MSKSTLSVLGAFLLSFSFAHADVITESTMFDFPIVGSDAGNVPIFLNSFNSNLGTLNSVQLQLSVQIATSTMVINNTFMLDPLGNPIPTIFSGLATGNSILMLYAGSIPVFTAGPSSAPTSFVVAPSASGNAQTTTVVTASPSVPSVVTSSFSKPFGVPFAPITFSAQDLVIITPLVSNPGVFAQQPTVTEYKGTLSAIYDYTPFAAAVPEPSSGLLVALSLLGLILGFSLHSAHMDKHRS